MTPNSSRIRPPNQDVVPADTDETATDRVTLLIVLCAPVVLFLLIAFPYVLFFRYTANPLEIWGWAIGCAIIVVGALSWTLIKRRPRKQKTARQR